MSSMAYRLRQLRRWFCRLIDWDKRQRENERIEDLKRRLNILCTSIGHLEECLEEAETREALLLREKERLEEQLVALPTQEERDE